jgi:TRAP-type C4-dicarboxylate transport system substrate-binding protein
LVEYLEVNHQSKETDMSKKYGRAVSVFAWLLAALTALACMPAAYAQAKHQWRIQTIVPAGSPNFKGYEQLAADIKEMTGGQVELRLLPAGAVVSATQTLEAVKQGVIDGHINYAFNWAGLEPGFAPMGDLSGAYFETTRALGFYYEDVGLSLLREMYAKHNIYVIGIDTGGAESLPSRKAIRTVDDLKGMRIRVPPGISARILQELGATPVNLPFSEVFDALSKGVVDAADAGALHYNFSVGLHKDAKHAVYPGFHSTSMGDFSVNMERWNKLTPDLKRALEVAMQNHVSRYARMLLINDLETVRKAREAGVTITTLSENDRNKYRAVARKAWDEWAQRSPMAKRAIDAHINYLKRIGAIE